MKHYIGCSGFYYKDWKGIFYPESLPQRSWFEYYAGKFNTLELNSSFYHFPTLNALKKWHDASPANFRFAIKVNRLITHYKQFNDCSRELKDFYDLASTGLKDKLGPVLFQLPPKFSYTPERLDLLMTSLDKDFKNVIEFRNSSWWIPEVFKRFKKEKITFCGSSFPKLPDDPVVTNKLIYYRFHGIVKLFYSYYTEKELKKVADTLPLDKKSGEIFIFFNNTATKAALENASWLKQYLTDQKIK